MAKKKRGGAEEHENHERWLLTYADMITLLVAFFIMLYAMSVMNITKFQMLAVSVRSGFGSSMTNGAPTILAGGGGVTGRPSIVTNTDSMNKPSPDKTSEFPETKSSAAVKETKDLDHAYDVMETYIKKKGLQKMVYVTITERGVVVTVMTDKMLFNSGQANLRQEQVGVLNKVAAVVNAVPNHVRIEGHTDNLPIHNAHFGDNWDLSVIRATSVLRYFQGKDVNPDRLEATGYADQHPIAPNVTEAGRSRNRRVDIVIQRQFSTQTKVI